MTSSPREVLCVVVHGAVTAASVNVRRCCRPIYIFSALAERLVEPEVDDDDSDMIADGVDGAGLQAGSSDVAVVV